ncbi:MAG TPA: Rrf2 family transcriptional regulator [Chitinophagaceae bacterium]
MLSQKAKYALQALAHLASHYKDDSPVLIGTIAKERNIPIKFLEAILLQLRHENILISMRGPGGGYRLADNPKKISLAKVIRAVDGPIALLSCVSLNFYERCDNCNEKTCGINRAMAEARDAILKVLEKRTLNDIKDVNASFV